VPAAHVTRSLLPGQYAPAGHVAHDVAPAAPLYVPAEQPAHTDAPAALVKPTRHDAHAEESAEPVAGFAVPAEHATRFVPPGQ